jgi:hypothetical protein
MSLSNKTSSESSFENSPDHRSLKDPLLTNKELIMNGVMSISPHRAKKTKVNLIIDFAIAFLWFRLRL